MKGRLLMNAFRLKALVLLITGIVAVAVSCRTDAMSGGEATVLEHKETVTTYPFSDSDPVPILARSSQGGQGARLYPYFFFDGFSASGSGREWTVVRLSNPYISVAVLPQVGGKIWGATETATGREFLYTNHVLKFRQIALRGPWTSGGIEFNFGVVGHAPTVATPVDYVLQKTATGVRCVVGAMDLPSRTRWSISIDLPKDKAYFETNGAWYNPTPFSQSYYYWSCAAIKTANDLKYIFPGLFQIGHDYSVPLEPWPVDEQGRDLSWYRNNAFGGSKSYFTVGDYEDFYGAWYEKSDTGFGHWALYDDMPGRKVWIWDESRAGEIWVDLLTDKDGQYTEPQAGRLLNQSDHEFFGPGRADRWREVWFPYRGIGPMVKSSPAGALSAGVAGRILKLGFFALQPIEADLVVSASGKEIFRERLTMKPEEIIKKDIPLESPERPFTVHIGDVLVYRSPAAADDIARPTSFRPADESTADGLFQSGARLEKGRYFNAALEKYLACLEKDPLHLRALARTAELYTRRGEYAVALGYAGKALGKSMYDPEANYVYGVAARRLGRPVDAKEAFGWASRSMEFRSAAYQRLAELAMSESQYGLAVEYAQRSIEVNKYNAGAYEIIAAAQRKAERPEAARAALSQLLEFDPLDHFARFELYLLDRNPKTLEEFKSLVRNELPHETFIEMALTYMRLNLDGDARALLEQAPAYPTIYAMLGFLAARDAPDRSKDDLDRALALSPHLVFPFREEEIPLFEWLASGRPSDWKPKYYLGLILWSKGRVDEAKKLFDQCDGADFAPFFLMRATLNRATSPDKARADYERAVRLDGTSWRTWHALTGFYLFLKDRDRALETAQKAAGLFPADVTLKVDLVKSFMAQDRYEDAAPLLDSMEVLPFEGASEIHGLFSRTHVQLGARAATRGDWEAAVKELERSKEYPEKLGTGKPFDPDVRQQDYLLGLVFGKLGRKENAEAAFRAVLDATVQFPDRGGVGAWFGVQALRRAGEAARAEALFKRASPPEPAILKALEKLMLRPASPPKG
jgi:tetratricopeptide (TPR) repeat protein